MTKLLLTCHPESPGSAVQVVLVRKESSAPHVRSWNEAGEETQQLTATFGMELLTLVNCKLAPVVLWVEAECDVDVMGHRADMSEVVYLGRMTCRQTGGSPHT